VEVCPTEALAMGDFPDREVKLAYVAGPEACNYCAYCEPICPTAAIELPYQLVWEED
jgi:NAD-dependent dihydropyrimidine dehydrogenase PreA subunit